jgi:hypothetical protein
MQRVVCAKVARRSGVASSGWKNQSDVAAADDDAFGIASQ